jgi:hypothetical protein
MHRCGKEIAKLDANDCNLRARTFDVAGKIILANPLN